MYFVQYFMSFRYFITHCVVRNGLCMSTNLFLFFGLGFDFFPKLVIYESGNPVTLLSKFTLNSLNMLNGLKMDLFD